MWHLPIFDHEAMRLVTNIKDCDPSTTSNKQNSQILLLVMFVSRFSSQLHEGVIDYGVSEVHWLRRNGLQPVVASEVNRWNFKSAEVAISFFECDSDGFFGHVFLTPGIWHFHV